jgi:adenylyl- and sulfurtransferase ThiI
MKQILSEEEFKRLEHLVHMHILYKKQRPEIEKQMKNEFGISSVEEAYQVLKENKHEL